MKSASFGTVLIGSNALVREGLTCVLTAAKFEVIASEPVIDHQMASLLAQGNDILLIIDIGDDFGAAIEQVEYFKRQCPAGRVAMLAHQHLFSEMAAAFRAGANAYFVKIATCEAFIKALELVMLGETVLPPAMLSILDDDRDRLGGDRIYYDEQPHVEDRRPERYRSGDSESDDDGTGIQEPAQIGASCEPRLSARHKSILSCLIEGDSNKVIARKMNIADATVKVHVKAILRRIHVHNRTQAAIWAMNSGLFFPTKDMDQPAAAPAAPPGLEIADMPRTMLATGSAPAVNANGTRHVMLPDLDHLYRNGLHRSDN